MLRKATGWASSAKPWKPHAYQERALKFMLENPQSGLLLDPGLGKTSVTLAAFKVLLQKRMMRRALVVAPLRAIYDVWPAEMRDWSDFHGMGFAVLHDAAKDKALRQLGPEHQVALINPEGFAWLADKRERLKLLGADTLVVDESSRWKDGTTVRFRALRPLIQNGAFKRRHILTGSPRPRNYLDLFGQIFILDRGAALGQYISHYRNNFFYPTGFQGREWALVPGKDKEINALVAPMVLRLDAKDYLKLPRVMERDHWVDMPPKVQKEYDAIEETLISSLFDAPMTTGAAARAKCMQIANGAVYLDARADDEERSFSKERPFKVLHSAKVDAVVDLYDELQGEPLLLIIGFHHDVAAIRAALGKDVPCINGQTTRGQASEHIERWNRGDYPLMMIHPASAGHALNLQKFGARHVGYFFIPDDYDHYDQSFRRIWRQGNTSEFVMRHHFIARGTVDEPKMRNLKRKGAEQDAFLDEMRRYAERKYGRVPGKRR